MTLAYLLFHMLQIPEDHGVDEAGQHEKTATGHVQESLVNKKQPTSFKSDIIFNAVGHNVHYILCTSFMPFQLGSKGFKFHSSL